MKTTITLPFVSGRSGPAGRRSAEGQPAKNLLAALLFAVGLFTLIALLDGVAGPDDVSPGTAFAAAPPSRPIAPAEADAPESWSADTSAEGTRPDAIH